MSNDLTCKETLNVDEPSSTPVLRSMPQTATTGRTALPVTQLPQQGPLQIPAHLLTQTVLNASPSPNSANRISGNPTSAALVNNQNANMSTLNHALLQQQLLNQMDANSTRTLIQDLFALQNQNPSRIVQNVTRPAPSKTATPGIVTNSNQMQRPQPSITPSLQSFTQTRQTYQPTVPQAQYEQQYQQMLQQVAKDTREKEQMRLQAEAKTLAEKQKHDEHQRAMKAKMEMERVRAANQLQQAQNSTAFVNGIASQNRNQIPVQPNRPMAPSTPSAIQQAQAQAAAAQVAQAQQALLSQILGGMSALSTLDQAKAFHKQITSSLGASYQQPSPPIQNVQGPLATSQLLSGMSGQAPLNMAASQALTNALQQASNIISQPTTSYQQPVLPTSSHPLFQSQPMTPHVTPTNNLFHGTTSSPRPQPSILRRGINAGPSPGMKRRLDDSRPASGNGTATPPNEISKAHRALHLNDENRDSPLDENGDSPTKKRIRKQTFETEGQDAVKMFQQANAAAKIAQPKRRGRPPRTEESQKVQSVLLDLDMAAAKPRSHHKKKSLDENHDTSRLNVPSQGPLIVHSPQTTAALESTSSKPSPREEKTRENKKRKERELIEDPDLSYLEESVADAVRTLVGIRRRKAKQLSTRNATWKTILSLNSGIPFPSTCQGKSRSRIEDEVQLAKRKLGRLIVKESLESFDDPVLGNCFILNENQPIALQERLQYLLIQDKDQSFLPNKQRKRLKQCLRRHFEEERREMTRIAGQSGTFDYEQMIGPGDEFYEKAIKATRRKGISKNGCIQTKLDSFESIAKTLRRAESDFIASFIQSQEVPKKSKKGGKDQEKKKIQEEEVKPEITNYLLPIRTPGEKAVNTGFLSSISMMDSKVSRVIHGVIDCMLETLTDEERLQNGRIERSLESDRQKERRHSIRSILMWAQMELREQFDKASTKIEGSTCTCPVDPLECDLQDLQSCPSCSSLLKPTTRLILGERDSTKDFAAHGDLRTDSIRRWSKQFSTILEEFESLFKDHHPSWYQRIEDERQMDYVVPMNRHQTRRHSKIHNPPQPRLSIFESYPSDSPSMQEWKRQRRFETFVCGFVHELPNKPSELNDSCNDGPTPWHVNRAMGPLSPFWKAPSTAGVLNSNGLEQVKKQIDPDWKPLRWPNATIEEDLLPSDTYDKYRLEMAQTAVDRWTDRVDRIINCFSQREDWLGTTGDVCQEKQNEKMNMSLSSLPSTSATPETMSSRRKLAFCSNSLRKSTSSSFGSNECLAVNFEDPDALPNHRNSSSDKACTPTSPIAKEIREVMRKHVEFIKEPLAGYIQQMEPTIDLLLQNQQIYANDIWKSGEILEEFEPDDDMDDNLSTGQLSDSL